MLAGYVEFILLLFLPGMALADLTRLGESLSLMERFAVAFGLSMGVVAITLLIRTSGFIIFGQELIGFWGLTLFPILIASLVVWLGAILVRRSSLFVSKPSRWDLVILLLVIVMSALLALHYGKYPIFPPSNSVDFQQTTEVSATLQSAHATSVPTGFLYYGVHLLIGALLFLTGEAPLLASQHAVAVLCAFSPLLVYAFAYSTTESRKAATLAALIYVTTGFVWVGMLFDSGLYPNFYGLLSAMLIVVIFRMLPGDFGKLRVWLAFAIASANLYISHYSAPTVIPAMVAVLALQSAKERRLSARAVATLAILVVPPALGFLLDPSIVSTLLGFLAPSAVINVLGSTAVSPFLSAYPFLGYMFVEITNDFLSIAVLALAFLGVIVEARRRKPFALLPAFWLITMAIVAPFNEAAWRFSFVALLPLTVLCAAGAERLGSLESLRATGSKRSRKKSLRRLTGASTGFRFGLVAVSLLLLLMFLTSESYGFLNDSAVGASASNQAQTYVYQSMLWLGNNSNPGAVVVSPTDSNFAYVRSVSGRGGNAVASLSPNQFFLEAPQRGWNVVAFTEYVNLPGTVQAYQRLAKLYSTDPNLVVIYQNPDVTLYGIKGNST